MLLAALLLSGLAATGSAQAASTPGKPGPAGFWIAVCEMPTADVGAAAGGRRTFRIGPQSFQERKPGSVSFGSNLCRSFSCSADGGRMEGTITSASLALTISLDPRTRRATWRTAGASGLGQTSGNCSVEPEAARAK